ncbi:hypothetical protein [Methanohalophilus halophilus]|uniref:Uncharacterized protein n=1 Tax=Methanohalophilus halophilus TaxID=2177 RepID=A0A1L3Q410_9EURY|nr:hypothetical protein [Methanohalophilus halophilus]APH39583.1 hypothetical protein BHR79_08885 [Methanohalophilus halophilus]RNI09085.1 hypothetical protein EFE40_06390 [Methanohalophilus halophilus]SDW31779.1 hypothetical protein SAMN04515625_0686 [Methanohalophilus halophilus]
MARKLDEKDIDLLKKLAPECNDLECSSSGVNFKSILPPVANHFSKDISDFSHRLESLSEKELEYLLDLIKDGKESLGCLRPDYVMAFQEIVASRAGEEHAGEIIKIYTANDVCE